MIFSDCALAVAASGNTVAECFKQALRHLNQRQIGLAEAIDKIEGIAAYRSSMDVVFVNTNVDEDRVRKLIDLKTITKGLTNRLTATNLIDDYYPARPRELESYCLLNIAMNFRFVFSFHSMFPQFRIGYHTQQKGN